MLKSVTIIRLFSFCFLFIVLVESASAQSKTVKEMWPCHSAEDTPAYFSAFMRWADQIKGRAVKLKSGNANGEVLATVQFQSFNLKPLNRFSGNRIEQKIAGRLSGYLKIYGSCETPHITGSITLSNGFVTLSNFGKGALQSVEVDTATIVDLLNNLHSLQLNIKIQVGGDFNMLNKRFLPLMVTMKGTIRLAKETAGKLHLTGNLEAVDGYTKPFGKHFRLTEGSLTYTGMVDNPKVYLKSEYEPHRAEQEVKIWHIVKGTIQNPVFKFKSVPYMEPKNIISYTLFGQPFYQLNSIEQNLVSSIVSHSAADRTGEVLVNRVETIATQKLSVDVVRIDNTNAKSGTVITTGWYINPRVFFAIQNVIAGRPSLGFYLEYYLTNDLKLILSRDSDYGQGVDLQYEYDY